MPHEEVGSYAPNAQSFSLSDTLSSLMERLGVAQAWRNLMVQYGPLDKTDPKNYRMPIIAPKGVPPFRGPSPEDLRRRQLFPGKGKLGPISTPTAPLNLDETTKLFLEVLNRAKGLRRPMEPEMATALQGTPAGAAVGPTRKGTPTEALAQFAQWMGMALPGRGGLRLPVARFTKEAGQGSLKVRRALEELAQQTGDVNWTNWNGPGAAIPREVSPKVFSLGRYQPSDVLRPERGTPTDVPPGDLLDRLLDKLLETLWSQQGPPGPFP